jgi:hypothetical protein
VARIGYDAGAEEAYVEYLGGDLYAYEGVPAGVFEQLVSTDSKGTFVNAVIKPKPSRLGGALVAHIPTYAPFSPAAGTRRR